MEELREAAIAYYYNGPEDLKQQASDFFKEIDTDGDGEISSAEFKEFVQQAGYSVIRPNFFDELDHDGNGSLDFWEVLTFFYVRKTRTISCDHCRELQTRLYFTCVECFECGDNSYDLCLSCYRQRKFQHHHTVFLDNFVMLMKKHPTFASNMSSSSSAQPQSQTRYLATGGQSKRYKMKKAIDGLDVAITAWGIASTVGCSIM